MDYIKLTILLPVLLVLFQAILLFFIWFWVLRKARIIRVPFGGMEYSQLVLAGSILFGASIISVSDVGPVFQSYKAYQSAGVPLLKNTFSKFCQLLLVVLMVEFLFAIASFFVIRLFSRTGNAIKEIEDGNISLSVFIAILVICLGIILFMISSEVLHYLVPQYINYN